MELTPVDDGTDCDTCGWNPTDGYVCPGDSGGIWHFDGRWGCYSGASFDGTAQEVADWLRGDFNATWGHLFTPESIETVAKELECLD